MRIAPLAPTVVEIMLQQIDAGGYDIGIAVGVKAGIEQRMWRNPRGIATLEIMRGRIAPIQLHAVRGERGEIEIPVEQRGQAHAFNRIGGRLPDHPFQLLERS